MKIVFLGTNGWFDTNTGNTPCILVETRQYIIILDAGTGIYKLDRYINFNKPAFLFLSHFHLDHVFGLHILSKFNFRKGLFICGQSGTKAILKKIIDKPFTIPIEQLKFRSQYIDLPRGRKRLPFMVQCSPLQHSALVLGYRFKLEDRILTYCTDTGYCKNAVTLSLAADLLITECSFKTGQGDANWPHLNPETAAKIAKEANAKRLALVHFDAQVYKTIGERKQSEKAARKIFKDSFFAKDGMVVEV